MRSQVCRTAPNPNAQESGDLNVSNGMSNFEIQQLGADLVSFELARCQKMRN